MFSIDVATHDIITLGQGPTIDGAFGTTSNYTGPVHIISGAKDAVFRIDGDCGCGTTSQFGAAEKLFPAASILSYHAVPGTGYGLNLQYTARETFKDAHTG
jgi:hypothetical protein